MACSRAGKRRPRTRLLRFRYSPWLPVVAVLALFVAVDVAAAWRTARIRNLPAGEIYRGLEASNPRLGKSLVSVATLYARKNKFDRAYALFELAMDYPDSADRARRKLQQARQMELSAKLSP